MTGERIPELTVRSPEAWWAVGPVTPADFLCTSSRVTILIHGYNNTLKEARESYSMFLERLAKQGIGPLDGQMVGFHWPGNAPWSFLSFASYPLELRPAVESGKALAPFLRSARGPGGMPIEFTVVGHSLGNRVAIEMLKEWISLEKGARSANRINGWCSMAAAVRVDLVDHGDLREPALFTRTKALHSRSDMVLHWAFPTGQTSGADGLFPEAVGRFGNPGATWTEQADLTADKYNHSDYWDGRSEKDLRSAAEVAKFFGRPVMNVLPANALVGHALPPAREIGANELLERRIGG